MNEDDVMVPDGKECGHGGGNRVGGVGGPMDQEGEGPNEPRLVSKRKEEKNKVFLGPYIPGSLSQSVRKLKEVH